MTSLLNRREMLTLAGASGLALALGIRAEAKLLTPSASSLFVAEGARLTKACMNRFWDSASQMYRAPVISAETVGSDALHDRGYTVWPSLIALHMLVEGETQHSGRYAKQIAQVFDGLEQYYSVDLQAYTAWVHFPGNLDAYYDDNSWAVIVLTEASLACRKSDPVRAATYLTRASTIMAKYVVKGYDSTGHPGGVHWGSDPAKANTSDRGTSSTAGSALAAMMLARAGVDRASYAQWGLGLLTWLDTRLLDTDGLIMDALAPPDWKPRTVKWTYNTGVPMRAYAEHYRLTGDPKSLARTTALARAAINQSHILFDQTVQDPNKKYYWDSIYFVHYLVDGLLHAALVAPDPKLAAAIAATATRNASYAYAHLHDPADGFYWRNYRLYTIGTAQHQVWEKWTGQTVAPAYDASERSQEAKYAALAVQDRPLVKTLLANAAGARMFWLAARLPGHAATQ